MIDALLNRRSIRKYTAEPVSEADLRTILIAAMAAPSAHGLEPWHFVVIRDKALLSRVPTAHPYAAMVPSASVAVLVCFDERVGSGADWYQQDCSAATENLLIAVSALGLGAVWLGVAARPEREAALRKLLSLPAHLRPFALVPIGHPAEKKAAKDKYKADKVTTIG